MQKSPEGRFKLPAEITNPRPTNTMLHYSLIFLIIAIIAGILGFAGIAGAAAGIAKICFFVFLVIWIVALLLGRKAV
jgi:uncharacterized membrane protein YtjA (UPF0391 family)